MASVAAVETWETGLEGYKNVVSETPLTKGDITGAGRYNILECPQILPCQQNRRTFCMQFQYSSPL